MKKILITGASGFIGSFLVEEAVRRGWQTWAGIRKNSNREYLTDERIQFIDLNYTDREALVRQVKEHVAAHGCWDYVIHNAGVTKCIDNRDFDRINHAYTRHLIEALQHAGSSPEKFIFMSSLSVCSDLETAYGRSKLKAEQFLQSQTNFPYLIFRPTGVYGPREKDYFLAIKSIRSGWSVTAGFEPQQLTFIYVTDLVRAVFLGLESPLSGKVYPVADGDVYTGEEFMEIVRKALGKKYVLKIKIPLSVLKIISFIAEKVSRFTKRPSTLNSDKFKLMKQRRWICDTRPLERELNFKADYHLDRGIQACIDWYNQNNWF